MAEEKNTGKSPDSKFQSLVKELARAGREAFEAAKEGKNPKPFSPPGLTGSPSDPAALKKAYERSQLNSDVEKATQSGTVGEAMCAKMQIDFIASCERAHQLERMTASRAEAHALGRRGAHGKSPKEASKDGKEKAKKGGLFEGDILGYVQDLLAAGASSEPDKT